jgi:hypothetical protein
MRRSRAAGRTALKRRFHDAAIGSEHGAIDGARQRARKENDGLRDFHRVLEALQQRGWAHRSKEIVLNRFLIFTLGGGDAFDEIDDALGRRRPGATVFTVTSVPFVSSASPRETASCAVFVVP